MSSNEHERQGDEAAQDDAAQPNDGSADGAEADPAPAPEGGAAPAEADANANADAPGDEAA